MYQLIITPLITEKSTFESQEGKYHFYVPKNANKIEIKKQLEKMYGKKVQKVTISNSNAKLRLVGRSRTITKRPARKKAIVTFINKEHVDLNKIAKAA